MTRPDEAFCTCQSRKGFMQDFSMLPVEWWVCANCGKPTRLYLERSFEHALAGEEED